MLMYFLFDIFLSYQLLENASVLGASRTHLGAFLVRRNQERNHQNWRSLNIFH